MATTNSKSIIDQLLHAGLQVTLTQDLGLAVTPAAMLTSELRDLIRSNKPILVEWLARTRSSGQPVSQHQPLMMERRSKRFSAIGLQQSDVDAIVSLLATRDSEGDDRKLCLECTHLVGRRCGNWLAAGIASKANDAYLPTHLIHQLQRCNGFKFTAIF